ncbi:MAG: hypothetical protein AAGJ93_14540, partial [Bacteroidota bacterium]
RIKFADCRQLSPYQTSSKRFISSLPAAGRCVNYLKNGRKNQIYFLRYTNGRMIWGIPTNTSSHSSDE